MGNPSRNQKLQTSFATELDLEKSGSMKRLKRWATETGIIPPYQSGCQPGRMTVDLHANIVQKAMDRLQNKHTIIAAVDLKAAFDRVWRGGLLRDLAEYGLHPKALRWWRSFIADWRRKSDGKNLKDAT